MARRVVYRLTNTVRYDRKSRGPSHTRTVTGQRAHIIDQPKMPDVLFVSFLLLFLSFFSHPLALLLLLFVFVCTVLCRWFLVDCRVKMADLFSLSFFFFMCLGCMRR